MHQRGGKRKNAGRPATGKTTTKATIYIKDRELLNNLSEKFNLSVNKLISLVFNQHDIEEQIKNLLNNN